MKKEVLSLACEDFMRYLESEGVTALLITANKVGDRYEASTSAVAPDNLPEWKNILALALQKSMKNRDYLSEIVTKAMMA